VGSPNRILREEINGTVIVRTGRRIPGVTPVAGVHHPISICRMAVEVIARVRAKLEAWSSLGAIA
jgi:isocitrate dehydrogenase (NAD+)